MRSILLPLAVTAALAKISLAAPLADAPAQGTPVKPRHELTAELREFRKTAIPVEFPGNGLTLKGWIYKPQGPGPFPAVVWNHGSEKEPTAHPELGKFYTSHGYLLFLPIRHGHTPSPGEYIQDVIDRYRFQIHDRATFQRQVVGLQDVYNEDVTAAIAWIKKQPFVDSRHIVVTGCSYGGIQTLLTAEKGLGVSAFIAFGPAAMSWGNAELRNRLLTAVRAAKAPVFLIQAENDYDLGPSEALGPVIRAKGFLNRAKVYPAFGTTHPEGHFGFACWEEGIAIWGPDVLQFLAQAGVPMKPATQERAPGRSPRSG
jgi:dienelactone hydrolase